MVAAWCVVPQGAALADLNLTVHTTPHGGNFAPRNVVATWVEDSAGNFVKTIDRWSDVRTSHLIAWLAKAGKTDVDAISGATRDVHINDLQIKWDLKDRAGAVVPDGTYTIRMELADSNSTAATQNDQGTYTFVKNATASTQMAVTSGGFTTNISFSPTITNNCNNGKIDPGETCDPVGSCPTSCPLSADSCKPNVLSGAAATCSSKCVVQTITACVSGDGCCAAGCDASTDSDCKAGAGGGGDDDGGGSNGVSGGCSTGAAPQLASLWALAAVAFLVRRKRRA